MTRATTVSAILIFSFCQCAMSDTCIDTFETFDPTMWPISDPPNVPPAFQSMTTDTGLPLCVPGTGTGQTVGGVRVATVQRDSGPLGIRADILPPGGGLLDRFAVSTAAETDGKAFLSYPGTGPLGGNLNLDLKYDGNVPAGAALVVDFINADLNTDVKVTLESGWTGAGPALVDMQSMTTTTPTGQLSFPLSGFTTVDTNDIDRIEVEFDTQEAGDITAVFIGFDWGTATTEPEPSSILIWSLAGVVGLVASKRFRKRSPQ